MVAQRLASCSFKECCTACCTPDVAVSKAIQYSTARHGCNPIPCTPPVRIMLRYAFAKCIYPVTLGIAWASSYLFNLQLLKHFCILCSCPLPAAAQEQHHKHSKISATTPKHASAAPTAAVSTCLLCISAALPFSSCCTNATAEDITAAHQRSVNS